MGCSDMRLDVVFYFLGIICFALTIFIPFYDTINLITASFMIVLILFGLLFMAFGYSTRPRKFQIIRLPPKPIETKPAEQKTSQQPPPAQPPIIPSPTVTSKGLTEIKIKGIGPRRLAQLKTLQITSVEELAKWSAADLAAKIGVSTKITAKWIEEARRLLGEVV
ncbi:MAG: helix-hairpin-helix domain-containing protein [Candidatus Bathyarchaeia archaeon]